MISINFRNVMASRVGADHGINDKELEEAIERTGTLCARFDEACSLGTLGFASLPHNGNAAKEIESHIRKCCKGFCDFVQIGIGGSALGATALVSALAPRFLNERKGSSPRIFVLDNVDPEETCALLKTVNLERTVFNVVTKSGTTTETMAGFLVVLNRLRSAFGDAWKEHIIVTTDPKKGFLREFAAKEGLATFDIPPNVGGRFSVLTPVGLLAAAVAGIHINDLLEGAREADSLCRNRDPRKNPAYLFALAAHLLDTRKGKAIHVMMPYARALRETAAWFVQLWAESLGKTPDVGPTPLVAVGATDQHSQIQLYNEGPNNKIITFIECERFRADETIPEIMGADAPCAFLQGHTLSGILSALKEGTESALTQNGRPNMTIRLKEISARTLGALFYLLEAATAYSGWLYDVNAYDQPGVEAGKKSAYSRLGRPGSPPPEPDPDDPRYIVP